jgi:hypothetical protein
MKHDDGKKARIRNTENARSLLTAQGKKGKFRRMAKFNARRKAGEEE